MLPHIAPFRPSVILIRFRPPLFAHLVVANGHPTRLDLQYSIYQSDVTQVQQSLKKSFTDVEAQ